MTEMGLRVAEMELRAEIRGKLEILVLAERKKMMSLTVFQILMMLKSSCLFSLLRRLKLKRGGTFETGIWLSYVMAMFHKTSD